MHTRTLAFILSVVSVAALTARADEVIFKSGDKLMGTVKSVEGGKMTFESKVAGTITLSLDDIKTFTTEQPIAVVTKQNAEEPINQAAAASGKEGFVSMGGKTDVALADIDKVNPPAVKWTGKVTAGAVLARGNTHSTSASLGYEAARRSENFRLSSLGAYYFENQKDLSTKEKHTTADNFFVKGQADWFFTEKSYLYGNIKYEKDRIALLDKRLTPGAGYGYQWIEESDMNFSTEAGFAWTYEKYKDPTDENRYMSGRLAYHVDKTLWSKVKLYHNLEWLPSFKNSDMYLINADAGLQAPITDRLAFDAKAIWAYNNNPAADRYRTDSRYIMGLSWLF